MTLTFREDVDDEGHTAKNERFESLHSVHTLTGDGKHLITLSGIVRIDMKGISREEWRTEDIIIKPKIVYIPIDRALVVQHWAPFVTPQTIYNEGTASYAGWGVNSFSVDLPPDHKILYVSPYADIRARILVRDIDGWIFRIAYHLTLSGTLVEYIWKGDV